MRIFLIALGLTVIFVNIQAFATSWWYQMAYFLDWKNTHFHDDQMLSALCITQYRLLKEKNELYNPNLEEPKYFDWCPWLSMVGILHINSLHNLHDARDNFRDGVIAPDKEDGMNNVPVYHFDGEQFQQTNLRLMTDLQNIISLIKVDDATFVSNLPSIRRQIAINIHGIQDFYAHTNWVELGYTNIISQLGFKNVMSQIPVANGAKCKECEKTDMTAEELEEYTKLNNSWIYKPLLEHIHSLIDFKLDRVYVCRNNTINNGVTSGYYGAELGNAQKSQGQCSHGGGTDSSAGQSAKGGISKDADTLFFAPHYYNHEAAAKLATTASIEYFANLRSSILDDDKFGQILGLKVPNSIAIMIDTTGSMQYSIEAAKTAAKNLVISSNSSNLFYLIPVNDPDYGPVLTYTNVTDMVNMIDTLDADGGGDTPEQQFPALLQTLLTVRQSTPIYVFTDSTSHHQELLPQIQKLAASKKIAITFMMTGENGFVKSFGNFTQKPILGQELDTDTISTIDDYKSLSLGTGGIYLLTNNENINSTSKVVSQTNWQTLIFENIQYQANQTWSFPVDDTTLKVQVVIVANLNSYLSYLNISLFASGIDLMKNNNTVLLNLTTIRAYEFDATDFSTWTLNINNLYSYYGYTVTIRASSTFDSKMTIIDTSGAILAGQPLATSSYNFFFDCSDCKNIDKVNFKSCQSNLPILINNNTVSKMNNRNEWYVTNVTFPVSTQVCIEIFGQTKGSKLFQRLVQEKLFVSTVSIELNIVSNNASYGSVFPQQNTSIIYNLANTGTQNDTFGVTVTTSNLNFKIWNFNNTVFVPSNGSINGLIIITADGSIGDFTTIGISVTSIADPSISNTADLSLMIVDPNPDVYPPICKILSETWKSCSANPDQCSGQTYNAQIQFSDQGSGVAKISYSAGNWTIPDLYEFSENSTYNTSNVLYTANATISCCQFYTEFSVVDHVGLFDICSFIVDIYPPVCKIISDTSKSCPQTTEQCKGKTYDTNIEFSDKGTGVANISYSNGIWTVPDLYEFNNTALYNTSDTIYKANASIDCCTKSTDFTVFDYAGLSKKCSFTVNLTTPIPTTPPNAANREMLFNFSAFMFLIFFYL